MKTRKLGKVEVHSCIPVITEPFIWISVREPEDANPDEFYADVTLPDTCKGILKLVFSDLHCDDWSPEKVEQLRIQHPKIFIPFNIHMKQQLDAFIDKHKDVCLCVTNCFGGVSRSATLSAYIERVTNEPGWFKRYYRTKGSMPTNYICNILGLPEYTPADFELRE